MSECTEFFYSPKASRLFKEKDALCRIFGSMTHAQCRLIAEAFDNGPYGMSLHDKLEYEFGMQAQITRNLPYLHACQNLISHNQTTNPLGMAVIILVP